MCVTTVGTVNMRLVALYIKYSFRCGNTPLNLFRCEINNKPKALQAWPVLRNCAVQHGSGPCSNPHTLSDIPHAAQLIEISIIIVYYRIKYEVYFAHSMWPFPHLPLSMEHPALKSCLISFGKQHTQHRGEVTNDARAY